MESNHLISGNPLAPEPNDLIAQTKSLAVGRRVPDGWRVLTGNITESLIARVCYRFELDSSAEPGTVGALKAALIWVPDDTPVNITLAPKDGAEATDIRASDFIHDSDVFDIIANVESA